MVPAEFTPGFRVKFGVGPDSGAKIRLDGINLDRWGFQLVGFNLGRDKYLYQRIGTPARMLISGGGDGGWSKGGSSGETVDAFLLHR